MLKGNKKKREKDEIATYEMSVSLFFYDALLLLEENIQHKNY